MEATERDAEATAMAREAGMPVEEVRRQFDLWERLLPVHGLSVDEEAPVERIREFLLDFATRLGDEDPERYADQTIADWTAEQYGNAEPEDNREP